MSPAAHSHSNRRMNGELCAEDHNLIYKVRKKSYTVRLLTWIVERKERRGQLMRRTVASLPARAPREHRVLPWFVLSLGGRDGAAFSLL